MKTTFTLFFTTLICSFLLNAQSPDISEKDLSVKKVYHTKAVEGNVPSIDGDLTDPVWESVSWGGDFIQYMPYEGEAPSQETAFKILYDEKNLYIAYRCYDTEPDKIVKRLSNDLPGFANDYSQIQN